MKDQDLWIGAKAKKPTNMIEGEEKLVPFEWLDGTDLWMPKSYYGTWRSGNCMYIHNSKSDMEKGYKTILTEHQCERNKNYVCEYPYPKKEL